MLLPPDYVSGLVDGEGCFSLNLRSDFKKSRVNSPRYFRWHASFAIVLRADDSQLLESVKETLGCGMITYSKDTVRFEVQDTADLVEFIISFFNKHKLYGKKINDFKLWAEAVYLIAKNKKNAVNLMQGRRGFIKIEWNKNDIKRLNQIREEMKKYKSKREGFKWN